MCDEIETDYFKKIERETRNDPDIIAYRIGLEIGEDIARAMNEQGLSYHDVAKRIPGRCPGLYIKSFLAHPEQHHSIREVVRIAHALGLRMQVTLTEAADESTEE